MWCSLFPMVLPCWQESKFWRKSILQNIIQNYCFTVKMKNYYNLYLCHTDIELTFTHPCRRRNLVIHYVFKNFYLKSVLISSQTFIYFYLLFIHLYPQRDLIINNYLVQNTWTAYCYFSYGRTAPELVVPK